MNTRKQKNVYFGSGTTHTRKKTYLDKLLLLEETGYEKRQTSMIKTTQKHITKESDGFHNHSTQ